VTETTLHPPWKIVAHAVVVERRFTYGDLIPYAELYDMLGAPEPSADATAAVYKDWQLRKLSQVEELRKYLLIEHQMMLDTEIGTGLRILLPHEQTAVSEGKARGEISRTLRDLHARLSNVDRSQLTTEQQRENTDAQVRLAARLQALRGVDRRAPRLTEVPKIKDEAA
jgi:hypothetical protein